MRQKLAISIHALLAESDVHYDNYNLHCVISIHALLAESDSQQPRGTTRTTYFYPRSPCGERPVFGKINTRGSIFLSTLSLRRATCLPGFCRITAEFLSTLSLRRATSHLSMCNTSQRVFLSTLSLRRATMIHPRSLNVKSNFYPRSPCGERPSGSKYSGCSARFLSTLSLRRATISCALSASKLGDFYPRSPCGERLYGP